MNTEISFRKLKTATDEIEECIKLINHSRTQVEDIARILEQSGDEALCQVSGKLGRRLEAITCDLQTMESMHKVLIDIQSLYSNCEDQVQDLLEGGRIPRKLIRNPKRISLENILRLLKSMNIHFSI